MADFPEGCNQNALSPWVGLVVDFHQAGGIDGGVGLSCGKRGVAEEFLDGAKVAASGQKVRGKAVPQGVGRGRRGQAKAQPGAFHRPLDQAGVDRATARATKKRGIKRKIMRAECDIVVNGPRSGGEHRDGPGLAAFAGDPQGRRQGVVGPGQ
jgi:hypothetical protein